MTRREVAPVGVHQVRRHARWGISTTPRLWRRAGTGAFLSIAALTWACGSNEGASDTRDHTEGRATDGTAGSAGAGGATTDPSSPDDSQPGGTTSGEGSPSSGGTGGAGGIAPPVAVLTPTPLDSELTTATGCMGVYNPDQILTLSFAMDSGDFAAVLADTTYALMVPAQMQCEDELPLTVGIRRKRSGGHMKVGFKVDINEFVSGQKWYDLRKLSLENGVSEGSNEDGADVREYLSEYLAWRLMVLSGAASGRAAFVKVEINGEPLGVYVNVEQVDKRFLRTRFGDDSGWLYKKSGGVNDGLKTNELAGGADNPYNDYFCFWESGNNACAIPSAESLATDLPVHLDIPQFLRFGAVNAFIANADGPLFKDNNYYYYDYATGPRVYIPWDLDSAMKENGSVLAGGSGARGAFDAVLFTNWRDDYIAILKELLTVQLTADAIESELARALLTAGAAFDEDPYVTGTLGGAVDSLRAYWAERLPTIAAELP
jgi:hypothetical protein